MYILIITLFLILFIGLIINKTNKRKKEYNSFVADKTVKLLTIVLQITKNIKEQLLITSPFILYEVLFYFLFINRIKQTKDIEHKTIAEDMETQIFNALKITKNCKYQKYEKIISTVYLFRMKAYAETFKDFDYKFSVDFFNYIMEYHNVLIAWIYKYEKFAIITPSNVEGTDYGYGAENSPYISQNHYKIISDILLDNFKYVLDFIKV